MTTRHLLSAAIAAAFIAGLFPVDSLAGEILKFEPGRKGLASVADPAASGKRCVAVNLESESGKILLGQGKKRIEPGLYQFVPRLRLHLPADYDRSRLKLTLFINAEGKNVAQIPLSWPLFDSREGTFTEFERRISFTKPAMVEVELSWSIAPLGAGEKPRALRPLKGPSIEDTSKKFDSAGPKGSSQQLTDLVGELQADVAISLASITYPAVLVDQMSISAASTSLAVERVWPEKVHVYPGEPNPVEVTVRNFGSRPETAVVRMEIRSGLDEAGAPMEAQVEVPAGGTAKHRFDWTAGQREYGHEARASVLVGGKAGHSESEYFSVGNPVWKTAVQGSGFITWAGREGDFEDHVESNRRKYVNVEEAFSWQPSSWTDLNPTTEDWWTGQDDFHNTMKGLQEWMSRSHGHGIKMITYSWPTASGPAGMEWGRKHPDLISHDRIGLSSEFHDIEDIRLSEFTYRNPLYNRLHYGVWNGLGINRGYLETIDLGAGEIVKSAKNFGWDGVRFDKPPGWSAMDAADVHEEFERMGVTKKMEALLPEYYGVKTGSWNEAAISIRNVRWFRHRFQEEVGGHFAMSYNFEVEVDANGKPTHPLDFFHECCQQGGQIMCESIRQSSSWAAYRKKAMQQAELARQNGGHHTLFPPGIGPDWTRSFAAIFTFATGSHPYGDYGWGPALAGAYTQFMTRYGEYCWDRALAPVSAEKSGVSVKSESPLMWEDYTRQRDLPGGSVQTVVHLISPPPVDAINPAGKPGTLMAWQKEVVVRKKCAAVPSVWLLSAEPQTRAESLAVRADGDGYAVTVPEHRYWSLVVWTEGAK